ncbi:hypothetical protein FHR32_006169 [Streptosporangium album]|uniref:Uncharacterized protein n=1 Tax=Streptosporangium album TaxID=47479 RepID=A0A7W7S138_9ACTN|nr:DUF6461 domain-containing protein [Streptosporangium album]MBB4941792.1 hypothetical protein [Streptosporangium album]
MPSATASHYQAILARHSEALKETCITWCHARSTDELAVAVGADPQSAAPRTLSNADDESYEHIMRTGHGNTLVVGEMAPWFIVMEPGDTRGAKSLDRLSGDSEALSLVIGDTLRHYSLLYARDGQLLCRLRWLDTPAGDASAIEHHLADLSLLGDVSSEEWKVNAFILAERITEVRLTEEWFAREHTRYFGQP